MRSAIEGSQAVARAVALCRPQVVAAYPITPQTHIVESISRLVADGELKAELVSVESEFSAASVVLGAAAAGSRAYTASSSQGILLMAEVLYNIAGLRVPLVMTCANRAIGAPLSIWNDHQDSMAVRDAGWVQLYCADNQEAVDTTIQAFRIAEATELPVMVCMDGFILTHTLEVVDMPSAETVDAYLPAYHFARRLDPEKPITMGTLVAPDYFTEIRYANHKALVDAADAVLDADRQWQRATGRASGGLVQVAGDDGAKVGILTLGSVFGTLLAGQRQYPQRKKARLLRLRCFRPFPVDALIAACDGLSDLIVAERAIAPGLGGIVGTEVRAALSALKRPPKVHSVAIGLGGRDVGLETYPRLMQALKDMDGTGFEIFDVQPEKLPAEDR